MRNSDFVVLGYASKGPLTPTIIKDVKELNNIYGYPKPDSYLVYGVEQCLAETDKVLALRLPTEGAAQAACMEESMFIHAESNGEEGNNTSVRIKHTKKDTFSLEVFNNGECVESYETLSKAKNSRYYVESFMEFASHWIRVQNYSPVLLPKEGVYQLYGGKDGERQPGILPETLKLLDEFNVDVISVPGFTEPAEVNALLEYCEKRGDCMAAVDVPEGLDWHDANLHIRQLRQSNYGSIFWPWCETRDYFNHRNVWLPPSCFALKALLNRDKTAPWLSATGGTITDVLNVQHKSVKSTSSINQIVEMRNIKQHILRGQETLGEDSIINRRILNHVRREVINCGNGLAEVYPINSQGFRNKFEQNCEYILSEIYESGGIGDFMIQTDDEINNPEIVQMKNRFRAKIGIETKAAQRIFLYAEFAKNFNESVYK